MRKLAITRDVSPAIVRCELTHLARTPIDVERARAQHDEYERQIERLGYRILRLPVDSELPDSVFVEDTAIVLDEIAIIARPGAPARRPETAAAAETLRQYRPLENLEEPCTLDGGDVLKIGKHLYIGLSQRTNRAAIDTVTRIVEPFGYRTTAVSVRECLHLKSAATLVDRETVLLNPDWIGPEIFPGLRIIRTDPDEAAGANALRIDDRLLYPIAFPRTRERLVAAGISITDVDLSELAKAEGAVTCCSILFHA